VAALTVGSAVTPFASQWRENGVYIKVFTGTGGDDSTIIAGVTAKRHVIVGGRLSSDGADLMNILSAANVIDSIQFAARATAAFPVGLECNTAEALILNKVSTTSAVQGWIAYVTLTAGDVFPAPLG